MTEISESEVLELEVSELEVSEPEDDLCRVEAEGLLESLKGQVSNDQPIWTIKYFGVRDSILYAPLYSEDSRGNWTSLLG